MKTSLLLFFLLWLQFCAAQPGEISLFEKMNVEIQQLVKHNGDVIPVIPSRNLIYSCYNETDHGFESEKESAIVRIFNLKKTAKFGEIYNEIYWGNYWTGDLTQPSSGFQIESREMDIQRVLIVYKGDSMIIDVKNLRSYIKKNEKKLHSRIQMEKVTFQKGYFVYKITDAAFIKDPDGNYSILKNLTSKNTSYFIQKEALNVDWLNETNLPASYFFAEGKNLIESHQFNFVYKQDSVNEMMLDTAIQLLNRSILLDSIENGTEKYSLLTSAYSIFKKYPLAIASCSKEIDLLLRMKNADRDIITNALQKRIAFYVAIDDEKNVLQDYDLLFKYSSYPSYRFDKIAYLLTKERFEEALSERALDEDTNWNTKWHYGRTIGLVYYMNGQHERAYGEWLISLKLNVWNNRTSNKAWISWPKWPVALDNTVDSILQSPVDKTPELILCRAYYFILANNQPFGDSLNTTIQIINADLDLLISQGILLADAYYLKTKITEDIDEQKALEYINKAIEYDAENPVFYLTRYYLRMHLGLTHKTWRSNENEPDMDEYKKRWKNYLYRM